MTDPQDDVRCGSNAKTNSKATLSNQCFSLRLWSPCSQQKPAVKTPKIVTVALQIHVQIGAVFLRIIMLS